MAAVNQGFDPLPLTNAHAHAPQTSSPTPLALPQLPSPSPLTHPSLRGELPTLRDRANSAGTQCLRRGFDPGPRLLTLVHCHEQVTTLSVVLARRHPREAQPTAHRFPPNQLPTLPRPVKHSSRCPTPGCQPRLTPRPTSDRLATYLPVAPHRQRNASAPEKMQIQHPLKKNTSPATSKLHATKLTPPEAASPLK